MKNMLLTATAVGAAIAGLLLFYQQVKNRRNKALQSSGKSSDIMTNSVAKMERPPQHAMG